MTPASRALLFAALGRFEEAQPVLQAEVERHWRNLARDRAWNLKGARASNPSKAYADWEASIVNLERLLDRLCQGDAAAIAALLHEWEAIAVKTRRIERYWEPSPFPFEKL